MKEGLINPSYVNTKAQLADVFTKVVSVEQHNSLLTKLGVSVPSNSPFEGECKREKSLRTTSVNVESKGTNNVQVKSI